MFKNSIIKVVFLVIETAQRHDCANSDFMNNYYAAAGSKN